MGIPYSKQINAAFNQVTPLVASGYELLETVKNIAIVILLIQIGLLILLLLNLGALLGVIISINPDLDKERRSLVTPTMKWTASWVSFWVERKYSLLATIIGFMTVLGFAYSIYVYHARQSAEQMAENYVKGDEGLVGNEDEETPDKEGSDSDKEKGN